MYDPPGPLVKFDHVTIALPWPHAVTYSLSSDAWLTLVKVPLPCPTREGTDHVFPLSVEWETRTSALMLVGALPCEKRKPSVE